MRLSLKTKFKSLDPFDIDLPDLVILTGINGAGKTQLLTAIRDNQLQITDENNRELNPKKYVTSQTLSPNESIIITRELLNSEIQNQWNIFKSYVESKKQYPNFGLANSFSRHPHSHHFKTFEKIIKSSNKDLDNLNFYDFSNYYPLKDELSQIDIFYQNFSSLFKKYQDKLEENEYRQYRNEVKNHKEITFLSEVQFLDYFGEAPWDCVNKIIAEAKLDYHVNSPTNIYRDEPFELKLVNNITGAEIQFGDLSSGEKVLMSLALALYNSSFEIEFPKVLLMDEPDASLHPSMSKQFLEVIQKVFVLEKKVKVIITTHSPSIVALAPEDSIFIANKTGERIEKVTKDKALRILTSGVPSFSVNYENRRQVFVESQNDASFYEKIYQKVSNHLIPEISLSFISSGESKTDKNGTKVSNCEQVINITKTLREKGNKFVWGIIDWDGKNQDSSYVKVLGNGNRYSIENYLLDPILLAALLLHERFISREDLDLKNNETYTDFKNLRQDQLQVISDFIIHMVLLNIISIDIVVIRLLLLEYLLSSKNLNGVIVLRLIDNRYTMTSKVKLLNGLEIDIPVWYLHHQGHQLEEKILKSFPELNGIKNKKEESLKLEIINKIIDDIPELISNDLVEVFKNVQTVD